MSSIEAYVISTISHNNTAAVITLYPSITASSDYYLDAISEDGSGHLKQQCQHQHPDRSDAAAVK